MGYTFRNKESYHLVSSENTMFPNKMVLFACKDAVTQGGDAATHIKNIKNAGADKLTPDERKWVASELQKFVQKRDINFNGTIEELAESYPDLFSKTLSVKKHEL